MVLENLNPPRLGDVPNMHQKYRPKRITVLPDTYAGSYAGEVFAMSRTVAHGCVLYRVRPTVWGTRTNTTSGIVGDSRIPGC